jgi:alpha-1,2-mannosyltransferase
MSQVPLHADTAGAGSPGTAKPSSPTGHGWRTPVGLAILVATVIGLGLRLLQFAIPGHLLGVTEYDDGVYLGASIRLVSGVAPYKDFVLVQPPGVVLLMAPVAALGKLTGTGWAMGLGRLLTACAGAASVLLAGLLVRRRGLLAVVITCGIMAVYPDSILAAHTVLQEPWLVLACLAGLLAVFDDERLTTSGKRLAWGGVAFGFAGAVKLWAIFPIVVIAVMCAPSLRRAGIYLGGVVAGFVVPVLPFFAMDPSSFFRGVVLAQLVRTDDARVPLKTRLADLTGIVSTTSSKADVPTIVVGLVVLLLLVLIVGSSVWASLLTHKRPPPLEAFTLVCGAIVLLSFLWPVDFYYHYPGFFAPFLALALALPLARLAGALQPVAQRRSPGLRLDQAGLGLAGVALLGMLVAQVATEATQTRSTNPAAAADKVIPAGACVLTDQVSMTIVADRFTSSAPGCPQIVDGFGTDIDLSNGHNGDTGAARTASVRQVWDNAFRHAQYVWLSSPADSKKGTSYRRIAWTPWLRAYFAKNFQRVPAGHLLIYKRIGS